MQLDVEPLDEWDVPRRPADAILFSGEENEGSRLEVWMSPDELPVLRLSDFSVNQDGITESVARRFQCVRCG